jgi:hypothetical protein
MELFIVANGRMKCDMGTVYKYGQMVQSMKVIGSIIKRMAKGSFGTLMEMFLTVNGRKIRLMGTECIHMWMELNTKAIGRMIYSMARELKLGLMGRSMTDFTKKEWSMDMVDINGLMKVCTMANGLRTKFKAK